MEENFGLTWEDSTTVVQTEEVICGIENEILPSESEEFTGGDGHVETVVTDEEIIEVPHDDHEETVVTAGSTGGRVERIMYLTDGNMLVMQDPIERDYNEEMVECQVTHEEIITDQWADGCPEEIVVGSEEAVGTEEAVQDECDIPLPTDQDEYTAARPYPCDFCSRRFRKKANLMNHMVAHQTDRPHGCNLCGVRYIRKCDLMNHLKIHAYIPETDGLEEEDVHNLDGYESSDKNKKKKGQVGRKKKKGIKIKDEFYDSYEGDEAGTSSSRGYNYVDEDMKLMDQMTNNVKHNYDFLPEDQTVEVRYPVTDPRKPFVCQHCGVGFAREKAMLSHTRLHAEGDSPFECQKCGEMFWDPSQMRDHAKQKHGDVDDYDDDDEDEDYSEEDSKYGTFYCSTCGLSFHRQDNLRRHQRIHVKEEFTNEHEFSHVCNVCGESFQEALDLLAHAEVHARTAEHRCMVCGETATDEGALAIHVQAKHGKNLPPNTCMLCGRTCKDRRTLLKHSWEHSKEKTFACSKCAKTFHNKARLKRHMLSHRNKVVTCDVCGEEFPDGRSLMNHRHSHSSVSGRQFPCRECGKTFGSRSSQQIHIRIHTGERPYGCRFCWKAFADGGTLRKHERIHTGEKPYACAVCPRAFNQRVVLREHIRSHHSGPDPKYTNSMTPYCCSVCSDMFATSQDLILHLIHHCDMNTAMKRQPQVGPRKYKRRRKLKPHELEMISTRIEENDNDNLLLPQTVEETFSDSDDERDRRRRYTKRQTKKASPPDKETSQDVYVDPYNSYPPLENAKQTPTKAKPRKPRQEATGLSAGRPKMIHTQKTRVPVEMGEDGRVRHKTRTLVTRTQPAEIKSATGERIRPRTKNVSYHILQADKLPLATFPESDEQSTEQAVNSILKAEFVATNEPLDDLHDNGGSIYMDQLEQPPEVASEQTIESEELMEISMGEKRRRVRSTSGSGNGNSRLGRTVIGPGSKVRLIKEGMIVSKIKTVPKTEEQEPEPEPESILPDPTPPSPPPIVIKEEIITQPIIHVNVKQELVDPSPLHELAEISMQHASANAQTLFKCEMCSEVFSDRAQLLVHVPVHI